MALMGSVMSANLETISLGVISGPIVESVKKYKLTMEEEDRRACAKF